MPRAFKALIVKRRYACEATGHGRAPSAACRQLRTSICDTATARRSVPELFLTHRRAYLSSRIFARDDRTNVLIDTCLRKQRAPRRPGHRTRSMRDLFYGCIYEPEDIGMKADLRKMR